MKLFNKKTKEKNKPDIKSDVKEERPIEGQAVLPTAPSLPKGGDAHSYRVVLSPHIAEKGTVLGEQNKYIFKINENANKTEIKKAVGNLYGVEVAKVSVLHMPSKYRQVGRHEGKKSGFKKAIVTLKEGSKIDIAS
ncbi:MAG: 50S ribosomal protein L23 [Candidatus Yanofskybacteria bacterium]|nr:50S ribosomal protein L23 [Candidatus Yanofskybacteria bacterium]